MGFTFLKSCVNGKTALSWGLVGKIWLEEPKAHAGIVQLNDKKCESNFLSFNGTMLIFLADSCYSD